jgi:hypothetical protein
MDESRRRHVFASRDERLAFDPAPATTIAAARDVYPIFHLPPFPFAYSSSGLACNLIAERLTADLSNRNTEPDESVQTALGLGEA